MDTQTEVKRELLKCAKCGLAIIRIGEKIIRACDCNSAVIAEMKAKVAGNGGIF